MPAFLPTARPTPGSSLAKTDAPIVPPAFTVDGVGRQFVEVKRPHRPQIATPAQARGG